LVIGQFSDEARYSLQAKVFGTLQAVGSQDYLIDRPDQEWLDDPNIPDRVPEHDIF
jgi:hypothetical protein